MAETLDLTDMRDDELKSALKSLKNKEAKLEADLAIKEHPELEGASTPINLMPGIRSFRMCQILHGLRS